MSVTIILLGFIGFFISIGTHIAIWRWFRPKRDYLVLILIFLIIALLFCFFIARFDLLEKFDGGHDFIDLALVFLLYFALAGAYIASYPAIQPMSPSLKIVLLVGDSMPDGLTAEQIKLKFNTNELLDLKIQDLINSKLVTEGNSVLRLTKKGTMMIMFFIFLRKILGASIGRG